MKLLPLSSCILLGGLLVATAAVAVPPPEVRVVTDDYQTGHGGGSSRNQWNELFTDLLAFFFAHCQGLK